MAAAVIQKVLTWLRAGWSYIPIQAKAINFSQLPECPIIQWVLASRPGGKPVGK